MTLIVVLNDGETYTDIGGCTIVEVPDEMDCEDIEAWLPDILDNDGALDIETALKVYKIVEGTA